MIKIAFLAILFVFSSVVLPNNPCGKDCIGRVAKVVGMVERTNSQLNIIGTLAGGEGIAQGDKIRTGKDAYVKILMKDDTIFQLGAESEFVFQQFIMKAKNDRQAVYDVSYGKLRALFINKSKEKDITLKTPTVSLGIRGTDFALNAFQNKGVWQTDVALLNGQLNVTTINLDKNMNPDKIILEAGKMVEARAMGNLENKGTFKEYKIPQTMQQQLKSDPNKGGSIFFSEISQNEVLQRPILSEPEKGVNQQISPNAPNTNPTPIYTTPARTPTTATPTPTPKGTKPGPSTSNVPTTTLN